MLLTVEGLMGVLSLCVAFFSIGYNMGNKNKS